jgi:hypothetical protein
MQCKALSKQNRERCKRHVTPGMEVRRIHGGKTPRGPSAGSFKHGRYSKFIPSRLAAQYRAAQKDPELLSLRQEIGLVDTRINDLLMRVDTGESGAMWATLKKEWDDFLLVRASGDIPKMHSAIGRLDAIMDRAIRDHLAWQEIAESIEQRRKLVMSESQRLVALQQVLTVEQALALAGVLVGIVTRHLEDQAVLARIVADVQVLVEPNGPPSRPQLRVLP